MIDRFGSGVAYPFDWRAVHVGHLHLDIVVVAAGAQLVDRQVKEHHR